MKRKEIMTLVVIALVVGMISFVVSGIIITGPSKKTKVPVAEPISPNFPDIKNDPAYQAFFNTRALDPTQPIQIGNTQNKTPFQ